MSASSSTKYQAFLQRIGQRFPPAFTDAAWLLRRIAESSPETRIPPWKLVFAPFALPKLALRGQFSRSEARSADVLVAFFPDRTDYRDLLVPATDELLRRSVGVTVALPPTAYAQDRSFGRAPTFDLWSLASPRVYACADQRFRRLRPSLDDFVQEFEFDAAQRASSQLLMKAYCWQLELLAAALRAVKPDVVLGIHFMQNPGFVGAMRESRKRAIRTPTLLLQHGVFSSGWETHDFVGADRVLVWGAQAQRELARFAGATPPATVVGHPRLESLMRSLRPTRDGAVSTVLILGTNDTDMPERQRQALDLVAHALPETSTRQVIYRPHPSEPRHVYDDLVARGLAEEAQIRTDGTVYEALGKTDVVVGTTSTTLPEAVSLGIPAIQVLPELLETEWAAQGMLTASTPGQLADRVDAVLNDPIERAAILDRERPLALTLLGEPLGAASRIADAVMQYLVAPETMRTP